MSRDDCDEVQRGLWLEEETAVPCHRLFDEWKRNACPDENDPITDEPFTEKTIRLRVNGVLRCYNQDTLMNIIETARRQGLRVREPYTNVELTHSQIRRIEEMYEEPVEDLEEKELMQLSLEEIEQRSAGDLNTWFILKVRHGDGSNLDDLVYLMREPNTRIRPETLIDALRFLESLENPNHGQKSLENFLIRHVHDLFYQEYIEQMTPEELNFQVLAHEHHGPWSLANVILEQDNLRNQITNDTLLETYHQLRHLPQLDLNNFRLNQLVREELNARQLLVPETFRNRLMRFINRWIY